MVKEKMVFLVKNLTVEKNAVLNTAFATNYRVKNQEKIINQLIVAMQR